MSNVLKPVYIEAVDIQDAWFQCLFNLIDEGFSYEIEHGSYVGDMRREFDHIVIYIKEPQTRPLEPQMPEYMNHLPPPVEPGYIEGYAERYLMSARMEAGEQYTYGSRMVAGEVLVNQGEISGMWDVTYTNQIDHYINLLKETPNTNQAVLQVAQPSDCLLPDPPCLRHIDMRVKDGQLIFYPYFRSWDLWGGFPANLGGLVYLQEYMASEIGIEPGPFICSSKGLHIYSYVKELAEIRTGKTFTF